jgi:hypothetical protein
MAQYEAKRLTFTRDVALPLSQVAPLCIPQNLLTDPDPIDAAEAEDAEIAAARLGGVARFD